MCKLIKADPESLHDRAERVCAKLARKAKADAWHGGTSAIALVRRLTSMGSPHAYKYQDAVSQAYTSSTGEAPDYTAYECPECGETCMGTDAAYEHCADIFGDDDCGDECDE